LIEKSNPFFMFVPNKEFYQLLKTNFMETCKQCSKEFEAWEAEFYCDNCDNDGLEERWYDWCIGEPDMITCTECNGDKTIKSMERGFCSEDCREDYFYPNNGI